MTKPDWCPQEVWERAVAARRKFHDDDSRPMPMWPLLDRIIARALLEAERRGMERAAEIAERGSVVKGNLDDINSAPDLMDAWEMGVSAAEHGIALSIRAAAKEIEP